MGIPPPPLSAIRPTDQRMAVSGSLDKDWIDLNYSYLERRLGTFPLFEPSATFYAALAGLASADAYKTGAAQALRNLYSHVRLPGLPVHFENHIPNAGEFRFSQSPDNPDLIVPV